MSAAILPLPGAVAAPVQTPKLPRGRPPKSVASIRRGLEARGLRQWRLECAAALEAEAENLRRRAECVALECLQNATYMEARARDFREAAR